MRTQRAFSGGGGVLAFARALHLKSFVAAVIVTMSAGVASTRSHDATQPSAQTLLRTAWDIQSIDSFGIITAVVRCADILFLADVSGKIRRYNLTTGQPLSELGAGRIGLPLAMTVDCEGRTLYVMTPTPMRGSSPLAQAIDLESGELRREYSLPGGFLPRPGGRVQGRALVVAGIWAPSGRHILETDGDRYYEGRHLGLTLALDTGAIEPMLVPYETKCIGAGQCEDVRVDSVVTRVGVMLVASLPTATTVGIYRTGGPPKAVSVKSRQFVRGGDVLDVNASADARMRWTGRNSTIDGVFAFENVFVVVHVQRTIPPAWQLGQPAPATVFMNTYTWDGRQQQEDVRLPGRVVGRDGGAIYAIDDGAGGTRQHGERLRIVQISIND